MDGADISNAADLRTFLSRTCPQQEVATVVLHKGERLEKKIALDTRPANTGHVSDRMEKSERRKGFTSRVPTDAP